MQRRDFLRTGLAAAAGAAFSPAATFGEPSKPTPRPIAERICLFMDPLDDFGLPYAELAKLIEPLKIDGPDLTVRPGGVLLPDRAAEELPKAVAAFRDKGLSVPMITTVLTSSGDPAARPILSTMNSLGIRYYKLGYYHYHELPHWEAELESARKDLAGLLQLGRQFRVQAGFHNHAGSGIGGAVWDAWELIRPLDPSDVGFYFDPAHASIEGPKYTWKLNFQRISPRLTMVAIKDYVWEKTASGWQTHWCPLGEGMVNWKEFFRLLVRFPFPGPVSLHIEYNPGGRTRQEQIDNTLVAAQRDLDFLRRHLAEATASE